MKRYNQVRDGSYEPRSEMVEETDGDYVLWEDVEALLEELTRKLNKDWQYVRELQAMHEKLIKAVQDYLYGAQP